MNLTKLKAATVAVVSWLDGALTGVGSQIAAAKLTLTEILGAAGTVVGVAGLTTWEYAAIIGGIAVIFAVERQPKASKAPGDALTAAKARGLKTALQTAQGGGKVEVLIQDVLKAL